MLNMRVGLRAQHVCQKKMVTEWCHGGRLWVSYFLPVLLFPNFLNRKNIYI